MQMLKLSFPCTICNKTFAVWLPEEENPVCPVNSVHTIDEDEIVILQRRATGEVRDEHGKMEILSESKPPGYVTVFTCAGDSSTNLGDGKNLFWDWSNNDDVISTSVPGMKLKRIKISFIDPVYIKEGANYFTNALKGSYSNLRIVCPAGHYFLDANGTPQIAATDVTVNNYIPKLYFAGTCTMGDEQNTESCARDTIPPNYELWIDVYVPDADTSSYGWVSLEIYRTRTCLLPGESI